MKFITCFSLRIFFAALFCAFLIQATKAADDVTPALKSNTESAHAAWKKDGGAEFKSGITYVQGVPTLMLITDGTEAADKTIRRKRSIVSACEFLLDDTAFSKAVICVVGRDAKDPRKQSITSFEVRRGNYQEAVKKASKSTDLKDAAKKAKETDSIVESVCADLGVK